MTRISNNKRTIRELNWCTSLPSCCTFCRLTVCTASSLCLFFSTSIFRHSHLLTLQTYYGGLVFPFSSHSYSCSYRLGAWTFYNSNTLFLSFSLTVLLMKWGLAFLWACCLWGCCIELEIWCFVPNVVKQRRLILLVALHLLGCKIFIQPECCKVTWNNIKLSWKLHLPELLFQIFTYKNGNVVTV